MRVKMMGFLGTVLAWSPVFQIPTAHPDSKATISVANVVSVRWDDDWSITRVPLGALTMVGYEEKK